MSSSPLSAPEREALKALFRLTGGSDVARTGGLASALGLAPGTVTARVKRLAERGLLSHSPYRGVQLTDAGRRAAVAAIRRHRIVERFLADTLGYPWNHSDDLAASFEHGLPQEVEDRLFLALDRPVTCPHGFPIPDEHVDDIPVSPPLYALEPGQSAIVAVPGRTEPGVVEFLDSLGVRPGVRIEVREKHPFDGPLVVAVEGQPQTVGWKLAQQVFVTPDQPSDRR